MKSSVTEFESNRKNVTRSVPVDQQIPRNMVIWLNHPSLPEITTLYLSMITVAQWFDFACLVEIIEKILKQVEYESARSINIFFGW